MKNKDIDINLDEMDRAVTLLKNAATNISTLKGNIDKSTKELLGSWKGYSKNAFKEEYDILEAHIGGYADILEGMASIILNIREKMHEADSSLSKIMSQE